MLSDPGSTVIRRYDLLNRQVAEGTPQFGIPYPGTFVLDQRGVVTARFFEEAYQERNTVSSILARIGRGRGVTGTKASTRHLSLIASASDDLVAPGTHFSLILDVTPKPGMHVYAPGAGRYQAIGVEIDPQPGVLARGTTYPQSEELFFEPLNERVPVYRKPFRLVQDVAIDASHESQDRLKDQPSITLKGTVTYQACDDKVCFLPARVPVSWTIALRPLDTERVRK